MPPVLRSVVRWVEVVAGEEARLECEVVEGIPRPSLRWVHQVPLSSVDSL